MMKKNGCCIISVILVLSMLFVMIPGMTTQVSAVDAAADAIGDAASLTSTLSMIGTAGSALSSAFKIGSTILNLAGVTKSDNQIIQEKLNQIIETLGVMDAKLDKISNQLTSVESKINNLDSSVSAQAYNNAFADLNNSYVSKYSTSLKDDYKYVFQAYIDGWKSGRIDQNGGTVYNSVVSGDKTETKKMEFQINGENLQYRYSGETDWKELCPLSECSGAGSYVYKIANGYVTWCSTSVNQSLSKNWEKDAQGIVYYINEIVNEGDKKAYMSVSSFNTLQSYFENGALINNQTGELNTSSKKIVKSFDGSSSALANDILALGQKMSGTGNLNQYYGATLFEYLDSYYIYLNNYGTASYDTAYQERFALRELFNSTFWRGYCVAYLYLSYDKLAHPEIESGYFSSFDNTLEAVYTAAGKDQFVRKEMPIKAAGQYTCALFKGTASGNAITSCTNTEKSIIILPVIYSNAKITAIAEKGFNGNTSIAGVLIPNTYTTLGKSAFCGCTGLKTMHIPDTLTTLGLHPFEDAAINEVTFGATIIPDYFFAYSKIAAYTVPSNILQIGKCAFLGTLSLKKVIIPASVNVIGDYAFANCAADKVDIEGNPTIGDYAFGYSLLSSYIEVFYVYGTRDGELSRGPVSSQTWYRGGELFGTTANRITRDSEVTGPFLETEEVREVWESVFYYVHVMQNLCAVSRGLPATVQINCYGEAAHLINYANEKRVRYYPDNEWDSFDVYTEIAKAPVHLNLLVPVKGAYENSVMPDASACDGPEGVDGQTYDKLFDGQITERSKYYYSKTEGTTLYMSYDAPFALSSYTLVTAGDANTRQTRNPDNWTLYGSADNTTWKALSYVDNSGGKALSTKNFAYNSYNLTENSTPYRYYMIEFKTGSGGFQLSEIMLFKSRMSGDAGFTFNSDGSAYSSTLSGYAGSIFGDGQAGGYILVGMLAFVFGIGTGIGAVVLKKRARRKSREEQEEDAVSGKNDPEAGPDIAQTSETPSETADLTAVEK